MCINPGKLPDGTLIGCRKCWQCKEVRINDWVGRCIAESKTSVKCNFLTLTYGHDDRIGSVDSAESAILSYSDVQMFFKRLRAAGFPFRYLAVGEYGSLKGRAHWHIVIFWKNKVPSFNLRVREDFSFWGRGFVFWDEVNTKTLRYVCKYLQKDMDQEKQSSLMMSKKPPLGHFYFQGLAKRYVEQRLAPQDLFYSFPESVNAKGQEYSYLMQGATALNFIRSYLEQWKEMHPKEHSPWSELVEEFADRLLAENVEFNMPVSRHRNARPYLDPPGGGRVEFSASHNNWYTVWGGVRYYWSYDEEGQRAWTRTIRSANDAARLSAARWSGSPSMGEQSDLRQQNGR